MADDVVSTLRSLSEGGLEGRSLKWCGFWRSPQRPGSWPLRGRFTMHVLDTYKQLPEYPPECHTEVRTRQPEVLVGRTRLCPGLGPVPAVPLLMARLMPPLVTRLVSRWSALSCTSLACFGRWTSPRLFVHVFVRVLECVVVLCDAIVHHPEQPVAPQPPTSLSPEGRSHTYGNCAGASLVLHRYCAGITQVLCWCFLGTTVVLHLYCTGIVMVPASCQSSPSIVLVHYQHPAGTLIAQYNFVNIVRPAPVPRGRLMTSETLQSIER